MADIPAADVKKLRDQTGAGMMDSKRALEEAGGDLDKAKEVLRLKGQASAQKRAGRTVSEGIVQSYIHAGGKIGVLLEVNCESDFVARNEHFKELIHDIAMHIAASDPKFIRREDVPDEVREAELRIYEQQAEDKPEDVRPKVAEGRLNKWLDEVVLLRQLHVNEEKHESKTIEQMRAELAAKTGENVLIRRFERFEVGEE